MSRQPNLSRRAAAARLASLAGGAVAMNALPGLAWAQGAYPQRPITLIAPFGGAVDTLARLIAQHLGQRLGTSVIVDLKLGGSGTIGCAAIARAAPDGYTIGMGTSTALTSAPHLIKNPGYDVETSFTYLGLIQTTRQVLVVSPELGVDNVKDFIALAKSKPGQLNFGSSGIGNTIHLAAEQFNAAVGIDAVHVPHKTGPETDMSILAGRVHYAWQSVPSSIGLLRSGKLKALAVTDETRDPTLPEVPSIREAGVTAPLPEQLFGMVAPAKLPPAIRDRLEKAIADMQADPQFQASVRKGGGEPSTLLGDAFHQRVVSHSRLWGGLIRKLDIEPT